MVWFLFGWFFVCGFVRFLVGFGFPFCWWFLFVLVFLRLCSKVIFQIVFLKFCFFPSHVPFSCDLWVMSMPKWALGISALGSHMFHAIWAS